MVQEKHEEAAITDEGIQRLRARIGIEQPWLRPFNEFATKDAMRHFAQGIGDLNPLWRDEEYAKKTRWGGLIAPPVMLRRHMGVSKKKELAPAEREAGQGALTGVHTWYSGDCFNFYRPVRLGDRLWIRHELKEVEKKTSELAGISVHEYFRSEYTNQHDELVAISYDLVVAGGRQKKWGERQKYAEITRQVYTPEDMRRIDADYEREEIRGANPRYWEDVNVGDEIVPVVKGPLTITDMIAFDIGYGTTMYDGAHSWAYQFRKRHPAAFPINDYGVPDSVERVHWEDAMSQKTGNPMAYDYGAQRLCWLSHGVTNWMGDDGWLKHLEGQWRAFVYIGDTNWVQGKVAEKYIDDDGCTVELQMRCIDQRGRITAPGWATVLLPSRKHGPVKMPVKYSGDPGKFPKLWPSKGMGSR